MESLMNSIPVVRKLLSVVMPVYNEAPTLPKLLERLSAMAAGLAYDVEFVFVDDGCRDDSFATLVRLGESDSRVRVIRLSRNFGHQIALTAGLDHARGEAVVAMDSDLQDPPEVIPRLIERWEAGFEVVYAVRESRAGESSFKKWSASLHYRLMRAITSVDIPIDTGDFRLMGRRALDAFKQLREHHRYVRGMVSWVGFSQTGVLYRREPRFQGETNYTFRRMVKLSKDGLTAFSMMPLKLAAYLGWIALLASIAVLLWVLWLKVVAGTAVPGWASMMCIVLFLMSLQFIILGIMGEYIGRIYDEVRQRPLYLVDRMIGFEQAAKTQQSVVNP